VFHVTLVLLRQYWNQGVPENGILFFAFRCTLSASHRPAAMPGTLPLYYKATPHNSRLTA